MTEIDIKQIAADIKKWGVELGFQEVSFTDIDLSKYEHHLKDWIDRNYHGAMSYMADNHDKRCHPEQLVPGTIRVVCVRMDYALDSEDSLDSMQNTGKAYVSRYARGRDYHKLIRKRLQKLARQIQDVAGPFGYRAFVDSAPVLERALAEKSGLGWIGKNTMLINKQAGSWFFLGELFTDLPLPVDEQVSDHCGSCSACLDICPTNAFVKPNLLDATRCISYLTIELRSSIPIEFRKPMGNRIYGCDDCQLVCPWNKFSKPTDEKDFTPRHSLDDAQLVDLFGWSEREFLKRTEGSAIRRIGYDCWLRNIAIALGNAPSSKEITGALQSRLNNVSDMVNEHIEWALLQHEV
ncbi:MAG: tRNA epoxyqueuosine(34) reductase QueG [Gammaproteobacteria bacterium]|nr:tRNA epoxyqueuosine(34) reductase QueG [Gammaproteobacteria bacterium]